MNQSIQPIGMDANPKTIGILGTGQLGRMLCQAAKKQGCRVAVYGPEQTAPAYDVADEVFVGQFDDKESLVTFAQAVDVITLEFENIPAASLSVLEQYVSVCPNPKALRVAQNRLLEKELFQSLQIPTTDFYPVSSSEDLMVGWQQFQEKGLKGGAILKTTELGYDGKGQWTLYEGFKSQADADAFWKSLPKDVIEQRHRVNPLGESPAPLVLEARQFLQSECSVIVARNGANETVALGPIENTHVDGVLDWSRYPALHLPDPLKRQAVEAAQQLARHLDIVGLLCVEFFVVEGRGRKPLLMANEMAPRPHNSGHLTQHWAANNGGLTPPSQFDWHIAALTQPEFPGSWMEQGQSDLVSGAMVNLLGDLWFEGESSTSVEPDWSLLEENEQLRLYLYGKKEARRGRKMGHLNVFPSTLPNALSQIDADVLDGYIDTLLKARYRLRQSTVNA